MKVVGVTACPTGVAHTYMAQEALEKECRKRGYEVKIETQGSIGIENELSQEEVDEADVVIMAVAVFVEGEERFEDKKILNVDVNDAISKTAKVIDEAEKLVK
ncbi:PTS fructose transporter subunit IIB [Clostridium sp. MSJ-4]|uniref:PTS fructose transporter subunit IIB n=1 Tax=Clostridium simiarum TaxID=2841506 RepID=A0ABS6EZE1_9CLOT|nr:MULTISPECIES: PTS fructose transporter subunit IIB [Clostridium]MBU5591591.1 PTS fructose transporter subunit IIB [Clostridium simiarum]